LFRRYALERHRLGIDKLRFDHIDFNFITGFTDWLKNQRTSRETASAITCNLRVSAIRAYVKFAMGKDVALATLWVNLKGIPPLKTTKAIKEILSEEALGKMIGQQPQNTKIGLRNATLMVLMYDSACRVSEILSLKMGNIKLDASQPFMFVEGKGRKERYIPLMDRTVQYLKKYLLVFHSDLSDDAQYLFYSVIKGISGSLSQDCISKIIKKCADSVRENCHDIPDNVYAHMFRRTRATHLYQQGHDIYMISRLLGHEQLETTKEYLSPSMEQMRAALESSMTMNDHNTAEFSEEYEERRARLCGLR
jgi:site-specific recombinase XerD